MLVCDGHDHCLDGSDEDQCLECPRRNNMIAHDQVKIKDTIIDELNFFF